MNYVVDRLTEPSVLLSNMINENPNLIPNGKVRSEVEHYLFLLSCSGKLSQLFIDYGQYLIMALIYIVRYNRDKSYRDIGFPIRKFNLIVSQLVDCLIDQSEIVEPYESNRGMIRYLFEEEIGIEEYGPSLDYMYFIGDKLGDCKSFQFGSRRLIILFVIMYVKLLKDNGLRFWSYSLSKRFKLGEIKFSLMVSRLFLIVASDCDG